MRMSAQHVRRTLRALLSAVPPGALARRRAQRRCTMSSVPVFWPRHLLPLRPSRGGRKAKSQRLRRLLGGRSLQQLLSKFDFCNLYFCKHKDRSLECWLQFRVQNRQVTTGSDVRCIDLILLNENTTPSVRPNAENCILFVILSH